MNNIFIYGGAHSTNIEFCKINVRVYYDKGHRFTFLGFRLIKTLKCKNILTFVAVDVAVLTTVVLQFIAILVYWIITLTL